MHGPACQAKESDGERKESPVRQTGDFVDQDPFTMEDGFLKLQFAQLLNDGDANDGGGVDDDGGQDDHQLYADESGGWTFQLATMKDDIKKFVGQVKKDSTRAVRH